MPLSRKLFTAALALVFAGGALFALVVAGLDFDIAAKAAEDEMEFRNKKKYDATHCIAMQEHERIRRGKRLYALYVENRCSRDVHTLACFEVIKVNRTYDRKGWYCNFRKFTSRSRRKIADRAEYGRIKKWAACNDKNRQCINRLIKTQSIVAGSLKDPEAAAKRLR